VIEAGRIYIPAAARLLMTGTLLLVLWFGSAAGLAGAYGLAIGGVTLITSILYLRFFRCILGRGRLATAALGTLFLEVDSALLVALSARLLDGTLAILLTSRLLLALMLIWHWGRNRVRAQRRLLSPTVRTFLDSESVREAERPARTGVILTKEPAHEPLSLSQNFRHNRVLHRETYLLFIEVQHQPRARLEDKLCIETLGAGFFLVTFRFGCMESPDFDVIAVLMGQTGYPMACERLSLKRAVRARRGPFSSHVRVPAATKLRLCRGR